MVDFIYGAKSFKVDLGEQDGKHVIRMEFFATGDPDAPDSKSLGKFVMSEDTFNSFAEMINKVWTAVGRKPGQYDIQERNNDTKTSDGT